MPNDIPDDEAEITTEQTAVHEFLERLRAAVEGCCQGHRVSLTSFEEKTRTANKEIPTGEVHLTFRMFVRGG